MTGRGQNLAVGVVFDHEGRYAPFVTYRRASGHNCGLQYHLGVRLSEQSKDKIKPQINLFAEIRQFLHFH